MDNTITLIELLCHIIHADADVLLVAHCALKLPNKGLRCEAARLPRAPQSQLSEPDHENTHKLAPASNWAEVVQFLQFSPSTFSLSTFSTEEKQK